MAARKKTRLSGKSRAQKDIRLNKDKFVASVKVEEPEVAYGKVVANRAIAFLGMEGKKDFFAITNFSDFISLIRKGVSKKAMERLMEITAITPKEMAFIIQVSDRTLRRHKSQTLLNREQSERVVELARLYSRGEQVFGNLESFKEWMNSTVMALGNKRPKEFLDTSLGINILMDELGKIEHGIFA